ncbi:MULTISPECIES: MysB family protein [Tatumella]|uniref:MysB family protein n=1 Tax=Tatumella punctata TaxID=399969 RepID=A0ABW1VNJ5_9GAMM|nr:MULTISPECIES: MysB family protein [unclassified Tatumella]MBS0856890.1 secY/secA suppressor protein [Tatumella sp. JGM16]MBS0877682.1 secY/secA suppressor protein [Tatumella sp. JGM82]MBS0891387.1 secY/secA suppressor protein [Tatumella sp. JGM94]MBS0895376.1 secY/secA suppressor protein [Tatumella sp. JGM130]MBS0902214.1 secY/secA suppressor protein [Tatumella sp. JGM100]
MDLFSTLSEAIDAAREQFLADHPEADHEPEISQFALQKYVMQDGDIMWQAQFSDDENQETSECLPLLYDDAAQAIWSGDFDPQELTLEWQDENTLHEWDEGEFQLTPPTDTEEGEAAAEEWNDDDSEAERW